MIFRLLPATWIRWIGRLSFKLMRLPLLRPFVRLGARYLKQKEHVIAHGIGKGLRFNPAGSMLGYALGTADWEEQQVLAAWLASGHVFYDIGANVGFFPCWQPAWLDLRVRYMPLSPFQEVLRLFEEMQL